MGAPKLKPAIADSDHILANELLAYEQSRPGLEQSHRGKFVIFFGGKFEGAFETFDEAGRSAVERFGGGPYLIRQVGRTITSGAGTASRLHIR